MKETTPTLHEGITQGHTVSIKLLYHLRQSYYWPYLTAKVQVFKNYCQISIRSKPTAKQQLRTPLQTVYDPSNGSKDLSEIKLGGPLPPSDGYTHIVMQLTCSQGKCLRFP